MAWQDQLGRVVIGGREAIGASFDGVGFFVESADRTGGRRTETHEFPARDDPYVEDLGRKARRFSITGYVIGSNYIAQRDALIRALEGNSGPRELRHPYHGSRLCVCSSFTVSESTAEGGIARFSIDFEEGLELPGFPTASIDGPSITSLAADAAMLTLRAQMATQYDASTLTGDFLAPMTDAVSGFGRALNSPGSRLLGEAQALADFRWHLNGVAGRMATAVRDGAATFDEIQSLLAFAFAPPTIPRDFLELLGLCDVPWVTLPSYPAATPSRDAQAQCVALVIKAIRRATIARVAELAARAEIPVYLDARQVRDALLQRLDEEADTAEDEDYYALLGLRSAVDKSVPRDVEQERERYVVAMTATEPSLVVAHRYYGGTSRELELVAANGIERPGFIVAGTTIEVSPDV